MFNFEQLRVYDDVKQQNIRVFLVLKKLKADVLLIDKWKKASLKMALHLATATSKKDKADKQKFCNSARTAVFTSVAIMDILIALQALDENKYKELYDGYEVISKMLLAMSKSFE